MAEKTSPTTNHIALRHAEFAIRVFSSPDNYELFSKKAPYHQEKSINIIWTDPTSTTPPPNPLRLAKSQRVWEQRVRQQAILNNS
jgi:hypothetical protein